MNFTNDSSSTSFLLVTISTSSELAAFLVWRRMIESERRVLLLELARELFHLPKTTHSTNHVTDPWPRNSERSTRRRRRSGLSVTVRNVDNRDFSPVEHEVSDPRSEKDRDTDPDIECHEGQHEAVTEDNLSDM